MSCCFVGGVQVDCFFVAVPQLFQMMVDLSDDPDWAVMDEITEDDADR